MTTSLAFRTDLALRRSEGARIEQVPGATVVRMPGNPTFRWGNFLLVPEAGDPEERRREHAAAFPGAGFTTIGVDASEPELDDDAWLAAGFSAERLVVLTADGAGIAAAAGARPLASDEDWAAEARIALELEDAPDAAHVLFTRRRTSERRRAVGAGATVWLGVEAGGRIVATAGIGDAGGGVARFQDVQTAVDQRRRGHASSLVRAGVRTAAERFGSTRFVLVAERDGPAIGLYERLGFRETETQLQLTRLGGAVGPAA